MDEQEKRKTRPRRPAPARPKRRRRPKGRQPIAYNPGQVCLLVDLLREFAGSIEIAQMPNGPELAVSLTSDIPHLETFIDYKIRELVRQQRRLARLWDLSEAG